MMRTEWQPVLHTDKHLYSIFAFDIIQTHQNKYVTRYIAAKTALDCFQNLSENSSLRQSIKEYSHGTNLRGVTPIDIVLQSARPVTVLVKINFEFDVYLH